ncbi:MAG TPA: hypothetical protein VMD05_01505 [Candidatus Nanoarchaeia archaeon]|nr:hypothetical protein [Candidatus Nanoarchaeia archaeon]
MVASKRVLECPYCSEIVEVEPPDKLHSAYSSAKPIAKSFYADVVKKKHKCQNPNCKKQITVYWYAPLEYFSRI